MKKNKIKKTSETGFKLPSTRKELFFDIIKNHFPLLVGLGLLMIAFMIPLILSFLVGDILSNNLYQSLINGTLNQEQYEYLFLINRIIISGIQLVCILILSIGMGGIIKIYKRLLFLEPVFFKEDFKMGVKDSWKSMLFIYFILGLFLGIANIVSSININAFLKGLPLGVVIAIIFPLFLLLNTSITIYENTIFKRIKLSALIYGKHFFILFLASIFLISPVFLLLIKNIILKYSLILFVFSFVYPIFIVGYFDVANYCYDKELNFYLYKNIYRKGLFDKKGGGNMKINVLENGIVSSSEIIQTKKIQELLDIASEHKKTLYFPKGTYVIGTIHLRNNSSIELEEGALIFGAPSFYDFDQQEKIDYPAYQDQSHTYFDCSLLIGKNVSNISICGKGVIDMRSVWDEDNVRDIVHRGPKCITLKECNNISIFDITVLNATDLGIYFAGCDTVLIDGVKMRTHIDGISPDNSKNVVIKNCDVETGDDAVVFKSSYSLNRLDICENIKVFNCRIKSRCNPIKFGTETNGGFKNISVENCELYDSRICGISVESVDGANIDGITFNNIKMTNIGAPFFVHLGKRLRGPEGTKIGSIKNVFFKNISFTGPYHVFDCVAWNYVTYVAKDFKQFPGFYSKHEIEPTGTWQITSNVCGLENHLISNIQFENIYLELDGGVKEFSKTVPTECPEYPEIYAYGRVLPAYGIYFRYVDGVKIKNVKIKLLNEDKREPFVFENVKNISIK